MVSQAAAYALGVLYLWCVCRGRDLEGAFWGVVPKWLAWWVRSRAVAPLRDVSNALAFATGGLALGLRRSDLLRTYLNPPHLRGSNIVYRQATEHSPARTLDVYSSGDKDAKSRRPILVFFHGGVWTFFRKEHFRLLGERLAAEGFVFVVPGYSYYPDGNVQTQIEDLQQTLFWVQNHGSSHYGGDSQQIYLLGQSSGAHICSLALLKDSLVSSQLAGAVLLSGVYDPMTHWNWEDRRGVAEISPMTPACGGYGSLQEVSSVDLAMGPGCELPPIHLVHGGSDAVVPYTSSLQFFRALRLSSRCKAATLSILDGVDHSSYFIDMMLGSPSPVLREILSYCSRDSATTHCSRL